MTEARLDNDFQCVHTALVSRQPRHMALLRPAPIAIHHDGDVLGQLG